MISQATLSRLRSREAAARLVARQYDNDIGRFIADINTAVNRLLTTDLKKAARYIERARSVFAWLPDRYRPRLTAIEARYAHRTGRSKAALQMYRKAVERLQAQRDFEAAARARMGLMDVAMYLGKYDEALAVGRKALRYFRRHDTHRAARAMTNIGNVYHRLDKNGLALRYYDKAREIFADRGGVALATVDFNRANIYANLNRLEDAERLYRGAAEVYRANKMALFAGRAEYSLAYLYFLDNHFTASLTGFEKVLALFESNGDDQAAAVTRMDLAEINTHLNQFGSTVMLGREVIDAFGRFGMRYEQAKSAYFISEALQRLGDLREAGKYLTQAEKLFDREENKLWQGMTRLLRSRIYLTDRKYAQALSAAESARRFFGRSGDHRRSVDADITRIEARLKSGRHKYAVEKGKGLLQTDLIGYQKHALADLLGRHYLEHGRPDKALDYFKQGIVVIEEMLQHLYPDEIRFLFALDKYATYLGAVDCLLHLGQAHESFMQHSLALSILNQRHLSSRTLKAAVPEHLLSTRAELKTALKKLDKIPESSQRRAATSMSVYETEHKLWMTERRIRSYVYPKSHRPGISPVTAEPISEYLNADEIVVNYVAVSGKIGAFCVTPEKTEYVSLDLSPEQLEGTVRELHFLMEKTVYRSAGGHDTQKVLDHYLGFLHDRLMAPLLDRGGTRRLIFMVDGIFAQIPFAALRPSPNNYLKDMWDFRLIVNPDDLTGARKGIKLSPKSRGAVFAPSQRELPMIEVEGRRIAQLFGASKLYPADKASGAALRRELSRSGGFVHIAAHASRSSENPLFSKILMADGPLYPFDLFGAGIKAQLVSLSGCQTAAPGLYYGNSFSLAKIFYQGGARFVLASLWPVSDKVSMTFMVAFYTALKTYGDIVRAYAVAIDKTAQVNANPAFWSPFVLLGA